MGDLGKSFRLHARSLRPFSGVTFGSPGEETRSIAILRLLNALSGVTFGSPDEEIRVVLRLLRPLSGVAVGSPAEETRGLLLCTLFVLAFGEMRLAILRLLRALFVVTFISLAGETRVESRRCLRLAITTAERTSSYSSKRFSCLVLLVNSCVKWQETPWVRTLERQPITNRTLLRLQ